MFLKAVLSLLLIAMCVSVNDARESKLLKLIEIATNECMPKFGVTTHSFLLSFKSRAAPQAKHICAMGCLRSHLFGNMTDSLREYSFIEVPSIEREIFERHFALQKDLQNNVCSETDETIREQKLNNWAKRQIELFYMDGTYDFTTYDYEVKTMYKRYVFDIFDQSQVANQFKSPILKLVRDASQSCMSKLSVKTREIMVFFYTKIDPTDSVMKKIAFTFYCIVLKLDLIDEHGLSEEAHNFIHEFSGKTMTPEMINYSKANFNWMLSELRRKYLIHIGTIKDEL